MKNVTVYALSTCPWCKKAKAFFDEKNIPYESIDYDKATKEQQETIRNDCESRGENIAFPFVIIGDDDVVVGYNPKKYMELLEI